MKVRITNTKGSPTPWYHDKLGTTYDVETVQGGLYRILDSQQYLSNKDCEIVKGDCQVRNKYSREIKPGIFVDVYDVLRAFAVTDPSLQHLVKKALAVGQRGHKDAEEDLQDILDSAKRAVEMHKEWNDN